MFFFKKKTNAEKNKTDREMIESNANLMEALIVLTDNADLKAEFKAIEEQIKYIIIICNNNILIMFLFSSWLIIFEFIAIISLL